MNNLLALLENLSADTSRGIVLVRSGAGDKFVSYVTLYQQALTLLYALRQRGVRKGQEIILIADDPQQFLTGFWACIAGGIIPVPLAMGTADMHKLKIVQVWKTLKDPLLMMSVEDAERLRTFCVNTAYLEIWEEMAGRCLYPAEMTMDGAMAQPEPGIQRDDIAYLQFSSGSTGAPKGVMLTHRNLLSNVKDIILSSHISTADSLLSWMPLTHDMGLIGVHLVGIMAGISQVIIPTPVYIRRPLIWMEKASEYGASILYSPNFGYQYLLAAFDPAKQYTWDLSAVRVIYNGAEPIDYRLCREFCDAMQVYGLKKTAMMPVYGLAEASVAVSIPAPETPLKVHFFDRNRLNVGDNVVYREEAMPGSVGFVEVGSVIPDCKLRICNDQDIILSEDTIGHIQICGLNVTGGYYQVPDITGSTFTPDGWLRTGDLGLVHEGKLIVTGRSKNIIKQKGQNYYPHDIENIAGEVPGVSKGGVVAAGYIQVNPLEEQVLLFILYKGNADSFIELASAVRERIAAVMPVIITAILPVRKIPKTTSGKVQHFRLVQDYLAGEMREAGSRSQANGSVDQLLELARQSFKTVPAPDDNLFTHGIDSMELTRFIAHVNRQCSIRLQLSHIISHPDLRRLSSYISGLSHTDNSPIIAAPQQEWYPLSPGQQRFWTMHELKPQQNPLNIAVAYHIAGEMNVVSMQTACDVMMQRNECLRTVFSQINGQAMQQVREKMQVPFTYRELTNDDSVQEMLIVALNRDFCLSEGPLAGFFLWKTGENDYLFLMVLHHLIGDGWSMSLLLRQLAALYKYGPDVSTVNQVLPQAKDYYAYRQTVPHISYMEEARQFWAATLKDAIPINFPFYQSARLQQPAGGGSYSVKLSADSTAAAVKFSGVYHQSLYVTLLAAFKVLLFKYTGQEELLVTSSVAERSIPGAEMVTGLLSNTICLRSRFSPDMNFPSICKVVKDIVANALQYELYPFEFVLNGLDHVPAARERLFNTAFVMQRFDGDWCESPPVESWTVSRAALPYYTSLCDLYMEVFAGSQGITIDIRYNKGVFTEAAIKELAAYYDYLLHQLVLEPLRPVALFSLFAGPGGLADMKLLTCGPVRNNITDLVERIYRSTVHYPEAIAIKDGSRIVTYRELAAYTDNMAAYLVVREEVRHGSLVAILLPRSAELILAVLAILKCGAAYILIDPALPRERISWMLEDSRAQIVITDDIQQTYLQKIPAVCMTTEQLLSGNYSQPLLELPPRVSPAYIIYTSGSTGRPKGVVIGREALSNYVQAFVEYFGINSNDRIVCQSSVSFDVIVEEIFPALVKGATIVCYRDGGSNIAALEQLLLAESITVLSTVPAIVEELNKSAALLPLRILISGGDKLRPDQVSCLASDIRTYNTYGPSETTVCATYHLVDPCSEYIPIGRPIDNVAVWIVDSGMHIQPVGRAGEIVIGGRGLANGYLNNPELTAQKFVWLEEVGMQVYRTGDIGVMDDHGNISFLGRKDNQVKMNGVRIELDEIAATIEGLPAVAEAFALFLEKDGHNGGIAAFYRPAMKEESEAAVRKALYSVLPAYMMPRWLIAVDHFQLTHTGKIDISALREKATELLTAGQEITAATTSEEALLVKVWEEVLAIDTPGIHDNFFSLGGDSIKAVKMVAKLNSTGVQISLADILLHQTIYKIAANIPLLTASIIAVETAVAPGKERRFDTVDLENSDMEKLFE
ncbi:non-ribosomal peptide synthetase [Chitinophaga qingshengii]|uniref:Amino acid adenylation domain-containing protein n=1 Tax=Chitinophaga qingshengii TaxID=1569794 RepID=A0ABR7TIE0_9BACT|nr:non-ribosomal peptide synthetase [Chitinophaga qingshengii]MBC9929278.1 amino acid adenylation domain-containing protein [Chitinophaga qingshengii]